MSELDRDMLSYWIKRWYATLIKQDPMPPESMSRAVISIVGQDRVIMLSTCSCVIGNQSQGTSMEGSRERCN
jgi:hypothetical protein